MPTSTGTGKKTLTVSKLRLHKRVFILTLRYWNSKNTPKPYTTLHSSICHFFFSPHMFLTQYESYTTIEDNMATTFLMSLKSEVSFSIAPPIILGALDLVESYASSKLTMRSIKVEENNVLLFKVPKEWVTLTLERALLYHLRFSVTQQAPSVWPNVLRLPIRRRLFQQRLLTLPLYRISY